MAWKKVETQVIDIKKHKGNEYVGVCVGHIIVKTKVGDQTIWKFRDEEDQPFAVYGFTNLNRAMEHIKEGTKCKLVYLGTEKVTTKYGLKDVHMVDVQIDVDEEDIPIPF